MNLNQKREASRRPWRRFRLRRAIECRDALRKTWIIVLVVLGIWLLIGFLPIRLLFHDLRVSGTFGDTFGAVNALFSGLAFAGVLLALSLQRKELRLQRREFRLQRRSLQKQAEELEGQKKAMGQQVELMSSQSQAMDAQVESLRRQQFEAALFSVSERLQDAIRTASYGEQIGKQAYRKFLQGSARTHETHWIVGDAFREEKFRESFRAGGQRAFLPSLHLISFGIDLIESSIDSKMRVGSEDIFSLRSHYLNFLFCQLPGEFLAVLFFYLCVFEKDPADDLEGYRVLRQNQRRLIFANDLLRFTSRDLLGVESNWQRYKDECRGAGSADSA